LVDNHAGVAVTGWDADGRPLAETARDECWNYKSTFGVQIPPHELADRLGQYLHAYTTYGAYRPYGAAVLVAAYDERDKEAYLHMVEPSGNSFRYRGCSAGKVGWGARWACRASQLTRRCDCAQSRQSVKTEIEKLDLENMTVRDGLREIARIVRIVHEEDKEKAFEFEASWVCAESAWQHVPVPKAARDEADAWAKQKLIDEDMGGAAEQMEVVA
jgi:20S proteasome subunit alpha 7